MKNLIILTILLLTSSIYAENSILLSFDSSLLGGNHVSQEEDNFKYSTTQTFVNNTLSNPRLTIGYGSKSLYGILRLGVVMNSSEYSMSGFDTNDSKDNEYTIGGGIRSILSEDTSGLFYLELVGNLLKTYEREEDEKSEITGLGMTGGLGYEFKVTDFIGIGGKGELSYLSLEYERGDNTSESSLLQYGLLIGASVYF